MASPSPSRRFVSSPGPFPRGCRFDPPAHAHVPESMRPTLYSRLPAWAARAIFALVLLLTVLPALPHPALYIPGERQAGEPSREKQDTILYEKVVADIERGQGYYEAAAAEHRL